uniref:Uncharacterized protein n=1 Tax=Gasterosteus aculeatus aculeatus TaxID=481459 RepID=G3PQ70_GASAC
EKPLRRLQPAKTVPLARQRQLCTGAYFAGGDLVHQLIAQEERMDWKHTRDVAIVATSFHGNFNYFWLRALERRFPGKSAAMVFRKLLLDQSFASPLATSVFYTGVSFLEGKEDIFEDWREKFFNTWKFLNFVLMPLYMRTAFMGCCAFLWASFLCFSRQSGDGTAAVAVAFVMDPRKTLLEIREARLARKKDQNQRKN